MIPNRRIVWFQGSRLFSNTSVILWKYFVFIILYLVLALSLVYFLNALLKNYLSGDRGLNCNYPKSTEERKFFP